MNFEDYRWICPVTRKMCAENQACLLTEETGRTLCIEWKKRIQKEEVARRMRNAFDERDRHEG